MMMLTTGGGSSTAWEKIYENAICTIVDAAGTDADCGLYGVRPRQHLPYQTTFNLGGTLHASPMAIARPTLGDSISKSQWNTRGWKYQEICLSPRSFCFTPHEVFFSCEHCHRREGYALESITLEMQDFRHTGPCWLSAFYNSPRHPRLMTRYKGLPFSPGSLDFEAYRAAVRQYTSRQLIYSSDMVNAYEGIFHRFADVKLHWMGFTTPPSVRTYLGTPRGFFPRDCSGFLSRAPFEGPFRGPTRLCRPKASRLGPGRLGTAQWVLSLSMTPTDHGGKGRRASDQEQRPCTFAIDAILARCKFCDKFFNTIAHASVTKTLPDGSTSGATGAGKGTRFDNAWYRMHWNPTFYCLRISIYTWGPRTFFYTLESTTTVTHVSTISYITTSTSILIAVVCKPTKGGELFHMIFAINIRYK
ncbi:hypothetical protein B0T16DRAFT_220762 [Cercophora newfieldiana]|uniref:Heterokaryon incompatibility domain-containing protein n=1 Tax=Cercophora newfieldiana TaxID=92897 RepID=A0AA39XYC1_9PEZI|nr:hypothetical protein B0T16DRAFT_220762 [Cercophora newfieldiana]